MKHNIKITCFLFTSLITSASFAQNDYYQERNMIIQNRMNEVCNKKPNIVFLENIQNISYDYSQSSQSLKENFKLPKEAKDVYGLYTNGSNFSVNFKLGSYSLDNRFCHFISEATITYNVKPNIYISSELNNLPCVKEKVKEHELLHHDIFLDALLIERGNIHHLTNEKIGHIRPEYDSIDAPERFSSAINLRVKEIQESVLNNMNRHRKDRDDAIDRSSHKNASLSQCSDQERALLNHMFR